MDDYSLVSLGDSKNEWCARLVNTLTPCVIEGSLHGTSGIIYCRHRSLQREINHWQYEITCKSLKE